MSKDATIDFIAAIGQCRRITSPMPAPGKVLCLMADGCVDVSTIEELSLYCRWVEDGRSVEDFVEIVSLKKGDAETIYKTIAEYLLM